PESRRAGHMALVSALNQAWWVGGTLLGVIIGSHAQTALAGLDFVLASLFAVLAVEQWRSKRNSTPLWIALIAYAAGYAVAPNHALVIAIALSLIAALAWKAPDIARHD